MTNMTEKNLIETKIAIFRGKKIRKTIYKNEWWFSVIDVIEVLTDSSIPKRYWTDLKRNLQKEGYGEVYEKIVRLKMQAPDGKMRETDCANTQQLFRIIQSIPSPKAEPFKQWLAKVGYERVQEIENPELAQERMKVLYELKGYSKDWIDKRLRGIAIRQNLTDEWKERGINNDHDFAILTTEISKATFGLTPSEYKEVKGLVKKSHNLRDHMTDLELIFTMLGEKVTTEISQKEKPDTFPKNKQVAKRGGRVAGNARRETEQELGQSIISTKNFLDQTSEDGPKAIQD